MTTTLDAALSYAARGWPVLPLQGKIPLTAHGVKDATTDAGVIRSLWQRWPKANVGIACGQTSGLLVVDVDARSGGLETVAGYELGPTLTVETGGGGLHLYYRWPSTPIMGGKGRFGPGIDCQAEGRYVVAPPSIHPETGQAYRWSVDCDPKDMPQKLIDIGTTPKGVLLPAILKRVAVSLDVVERARRYVDQMRESVSGQGGHDSLFRVCCAVVNGFDLDIASARRIVDDYNATRAHPRWTDKEIAHKLDDAAKDGTFNGRSRGCLLTVRHADRSDPLPVAAIVVADRKRREAVASKAAPDHLLSPPGLVGEVARWIDSCSVHRCPLLSVAGALCTVATAAGRRYRTTNGVRPVLYLVGVAESGVGKETARQCAIALLTAAGLGERVGTDDVSSAAALSAMLRTRPTRLLLLDELGRMLEAYSSRTAASFERQIVTALIRLWSCADGKYLGKGMAEKMPEPIVEPHLTMYGTTTPGSLHRSLRGSDVSDGVLSRMLLVPVDHGRLRAVSPTGSRRDPPGELVAQIKALSAPAMPGNVSDVDPAGGAALAVPVTLSPDALELLGQMADYVLGALESDREHRELWVRAEEQAQRVALVLAVGCGSHVIERSHLEWGWDLVRWSIGRSREMVASHMAESPEDAARQAILRALERGPVTKATLTKALWRTDKRTREAALSTALDSGAVICETAKGKTRSSQVYRLATADEDFANTFAGLEDSDHH